MDQAPPIPRGLYALIDPDQTGGRDPVAFCNGLLAAGVSLLQLRDKNYRAGRTFELARKMAPLCEKAGALFVVNDRLDVALLSGAPALHLGPEDIPVKAARRALGEGAVLGRSTNLLEEAFRAREDGADYVAFGPLFETASKTGSQLRERRSLEALSELCRQLDCPVFGIGGIDEASVTQVAQAGAAGAAVISVLTRAQNLAETCRRLQEPWKSDAGR